MFRIKSPVKTKNPVSVSSSAVIPAVKVRPSNASAADIKPSSNASAANYDCTAAAPPHPSTGISSTITDSISSTPPSSASSPTSSPASSPSSSASSSSSVTASTTNTVIAGNIAPSVAETFSNHHPQCVNTQNANTVKSDSIGNAASASAAIVANNNNNNNNNNISSATNLRCTVIPSGACSSININNPQIQPQGPQQHHHLQQHHHHQHHHHHHQQQSNLSSGSGTNTGTANSSSNSSSLASPSAINRNRPTHRRGLSHGSFSLLNTATTNNHSSLAATGPGPSGTAKANTLSLGIPGIYQYSNNNNNSNNHSNYSSGYSTLGAFSNHSAMKANSSEYLCHADVTDGLLQPSAGGNNNHSTLHANQSGTSLVSQASTTPPSDDIKRAIAHIEQKYRRTKDLIKEEQLRCDDNVNEYLKLSANAEPNQSSRLRTVFENNNKKSTQKIARLQKKLKGYDEKIREIKDTGVYVRHTREKLKDGVNIITGISGGVIEGLRSGIHSAEKTVITKPKEFFKRSTNDSSTVEPADNGGGGTFASESSTYPDIPVHSVPGEREALSPQSVAGIVPGSGVQSAVNPGGQQSSSHYNHHSGGLNSANSHSTKCTSDDESSTSITSGSGQVASGGNHSFNNSAHLSNSPLKMKPLLRSATNTKQFNDSSFETLVNNEFEQLHNKLEERNEDWIRLSSDVQLLKGQYQNDVLLLNQALQDEKYRVDRLEEQLNDLTELHQREIENLRQTITDLEEKMLYQTEERHRDVHEMLESFQTRISRMEHQQHQHLQQLVNLDSLENSNARALVLKLINVLLTVLQVVLLLVATLANILSPFLHTRARIFTSVLVILFFSFVFQHWPELTIWTKQKIYEKCLYLLSRLPFLSFDDSSSS